MKNESKDAEVRSSYGRRRGGSRGGGPRAEGTNLEDRGPSSDRSLLLLLGSWKSRRRRMTSGSLNSPFPIYGAGRTPQPWARGEERGQLGDGGGGTGVRFSCFPSCEDFFGAERGLATFIHGHQTYAEWSKRLRGKRRDSSRTLRVNYSH